MEKREYDNFDEFADNYRNIHDNSLKIFGGDSKLYSKIKANEVAKNLIGEKYRALLDFGCGDWIVMEFLRPLLPSWNPSGIDVSEQSIKVAKSKKIDNSSWFVFDGFKLPFENESVDVIFVANVFHHIEYKNHQSLIAEFIRILKKGWGIFL